MILIDYPHITDPRVNLAMEEYALSHLDLSTTHLLFYVNEPSIIIGKHQNTHEEINHDYVEKNNIHVVRRVSGGGAVYHDLGNLNFSILTQSKNSIANDYQFFLSPVISALNQLGINAVATGRNDIAIENRKISGTAQYRKGENIFCHGTLLFNSDIDAIVSALNVKSDKIQSKGIQSIRSRVTNISDFLSQAMTLNEFKLLLINSIFNHQLIHRYAFSEDDWKKIHTLAKEKYGSWDWNYGKSPEFNVRAQKRLPIGEIDIRLNVKEGIIQSIKIYGDFFAEQDIHELEALLLHQPYDRQVLNKQLDQIDLNVYFGEIDKTLFLSILLP